MWVCVVSDPSKLWMDALIVAIYWVFHCRLAAKRLWVWSPGQEALRSCFRQHRWARVGLPWLPLLCWHFHWVPTVPNRDRFAPCSAGRGCREPSREQNVTSTESRALIGDKRWIRVLQEKQARKFWGNFCIFSYWEFDSWWNGAMGERRGANVFCARLAEDKVQRELDGAETVSCVWELTAATARDSKHQQSSEWKACHDNCHQTITALRLISPLFMG